MPPATAENSPLLAARPAIEKRPVLTRFRAMMWGVLFLAAGLLNYLLGGLLPMPAGKSSGGLWSAIISSA